MHVLPQASCAEDAAVRVGTNGAALPDLRDRLDEDGTNGTRRAWYPKELPLLKARGDSVSVSQKIPEQSC